MTNRTPIIGSDLAVLRGVREELRAAVLMPYVLRLRAERGEEVMRSVLAEARVDEGLISSEREWVSRESACRFMREIVAMFGIDALKHPGHYALQPEALSHMVRMMRVATHVADAYVHLADASQEFTRLGTWLVLEREELRSRDARAKAQKLTVRYERRTDSQEASVTNETALCAARSGMLASFPTIWGLPEAHVGHDGQCIVHGAQACDYALWWRTRNPYVVPGLAAAGAALGALLGIVLGRYELSLLAGALGGAGALASGVLWTQLRSMENTRIFERHRLSSLERSLELRGEITMSGSQAGSGDLRGVVLGGKYRIGRRIGAGGIGAVYSAVHLSLGNEVAVKVLRGAAASDGAEIARLRREAYVQTHVEHPNVARVLDLDQMTDGSIYVVMERLVGRTLGENLSREGLLAAGPLVSIFIDVCEGLHAAHEHSVVHRDLKPGNIFLCEEGSTKLLDFGMSKLETSEALTEAGFTLGTPEYMSPEQCVGAPVDARSDIYSMGVVMYEALTGELPIVAEDRRKLLELHQQKVPEGIRARRPDLNFSEDLEHIVAACLRKRPAERPRTAQDVAEMLRGIPSSELPRFYPPEAYKRPTSKFLRKAPPHE